MRILNISRSKGVKQTKKKCIMRAQKFNQNSAPQCKSDAARRNEFTQNRLEVIFADRIGGNIVSKQKIVFSWVKHQSVDHKVNKKAADVQMCV